MSNEEKDKQAAPKGIPRIQMFIAILWPSFLTAAVETVLFFTLFDPQILLIDYSISITGAYSIGFFMFWLFAAIPCVLSMYFAKPCKPCAVYADGTRARGR